MVGGHACGDLCTSATATAAATAITNIRHVMYNQANIFMAILQLATLAALLSTALQPWAWLVAVCLSACACRYLLLQLVPDSCCHASALVPLGRAWSRRRGPHRLSGSSPPCRVPPSVSSRDGLIRTSNDITMPISFFTSSSWMAPW
jgi:hypothetical protein